MRLSGVDRGRVAEIAALLCCVLFAALALWLLGRAFWLLLPRDDLTLARTPTRSGALIAAPAERSIASWHVFGDTPRRGGAGTAAAAMTALILRGTLAENDPKAGLAVIADAQNGERAFRVGDEVTAGIRLSAVYPDRAVLLREGAEETLNLARDRNFAPAGSTRTLAPTAGAQVALSARAPSSAPTALSAPAATTAGTSTEWRRTVEHLRQNPDELMKRVQVVPVLDGGKLTGVRLSAGADAALISQIGLRPGDVVTAVNGAPIDSFARGQEIMSGLKNASSVHVTVLRDGKPADVTVGLQ